ncbi:MAG: hypothetical protein ABEJ05_06090 [Haloglomus sp.]
MDVQNNSARFVRTSTDATLDAVEAAVPGDSNLDEIRVNIDAQLDELEDSRVDFADQVEAALGDGTDPVDVDAQSVRRRSDHFCVPVPLFTFLLRSRPRRALPSDGTLPDPLLLGETLPGSFRWRTHPPVWPPPSREGRRWPTYSAQLHRVRFPREIPVDSIFLIYFDNYIKITVFVF